MLHTWMNQKEDTQKPFLTAGHETYSYGQLRQKIAYIQNVLAQCTGDIIVICMPDGLNAIASFLAVISIGKIAVPLQAGMKWSEIEMLFSRLAPSALLLSTTTCEDIQEKAKKNCRCLLVDNDCRDVLQQPKLQTRDRDDTMIMLPTSGTTALSKIVMLSARNVETSLYGYLRCMNLDTSENRKILLGTPLVSAYGIMVIFACLALGDSIVLLPSPLTIGGFYKAVEMHKVTHYEGGAVIPQLMLQTVKHANEYDLQSLCYVGFGGSKFSEQAMQELIHAFPNISFCMGYGLSEAAPLVTKHMRQDMQKPESSGKAIPGVTVAIEVEGVITQEPHVKGEIVVQGDNVMLGYWKNVAETQRVLRNGWLHSGDIGYLDAQGYLYIVGRIKNIIIVRGLNVYPEEVEACLLQHSLVQDAVVYGTLDAHGQEQVCADVVLRQGYAAVFALKQHCYERLAPHKCPKIIHIVTQISKNIAGKTVRRAKETTCN